jgi:glycosyltransferase involved in cell wall biosynthesis
MKISVIIPVHNGCATLGECIQAVLVSEHQVFETIVVDDSSNDESIEIARKYPVQLVELSGGPCGPAEARNRGAEVANGDILVFLDSDVLVYPDTLSKIVAALGENPTAAAVFGSYDENPSHTDFLSQYKNLVHHFVHQNDLEDAETFWGGCGAVRREIFQQIGGFDAIRYAKPSIEDIDLGYRLRAAGHKIILRKDIQVKHLKLWSLNNLIKTDIFQRAVPWTSLILRQRNLPDALNLSLNQRLATILLLAMLIHIALFIFQPNLLVLPLLTILFMLCAASWSWKDGVPKTQWTVTLEQMIFGMITAILILAMWNDQAQLSAPLAALLPLILITQFFEEAASIVRYTLYFTMTAIFGIAFILLFASYPLLLAIPVLIYLMLIVILNQRLYRFLFQKRGILFALAALPMQLLYYLYSFLTFVFVTLSYVWDVKFRRKQSS